MVVKICGITSAEDAEKTLALGADHIGLNFVAGPRRIDLIQARTILDRLDQPERVVALVHFDLPGKSPPEIDFLHDRGVRELQGYGRPHADLLERLADRGFHFWAVGRVAEETTTCDMEEATRRFPDGAVRYLVLDAKAAGAWGGTGRRVNWDRLAQWRAEGHFERWPDVMLAGGLDPDNVRHAIDVVRPAGVDVSSGVEIRPGVKDPRKTQTFIENAKSAS